jgi:hypothetical protein
MDVRRVIAGKRGDGSSAIVSDAVAQRSHDFSSIPGLSDTLVWAMSMRGRHDHFADVTATLEHQIPRSGEVFVRLVRIPPDSVFESPEFDPREAQAEMTRAMPDVEMNADREDGMHETPTFDVIAVVAGEVCLIMENGDRAELRHGDVAVQLAGMHRWSNVTDQPAQIFLVHLPAPAGGGRADEPAPV